MPSDREWLLSKFREKLRAHFSGEEAVEERVGKLYDLYNSDEFTEAAEYCQELQDEYDINLKKITTYLKNIGNQDLIETKDDFDASTSINGGDKKALMGRMKAIESDEVVGKVTAEANQQSLELLSEDIYGKHGKLAFFISPSTTIDGEVRQKIRKNKESIDLLKVVESPKEAKSHEFVHFGKTAGKKTVIDKLSGNFYMYQFIANSQEYVVFSQEEINTGRVSITGTVFELDDATKIGDNRKVTKSTNVIFAHGSDPAIKPLTGMEIDRLKDKANHDWFARHLLGEFRHPELFEKILIATTLVKDENSHPSHIIMIGQPGTGKTGIMESMRRSLDERQDMMRGEQSTIKGVVPSFSQEPPDPGYLAKCHRVGTIDEFFNLLDNVADATEKERLFRKMLTLLEHKPSNASSGNGSISVELESTMIAGTNPSNGVDDIIQMSNELDEAFMSRCLLYQFTESHVDWIEKRKPKMKQKKSKVGGEEGLYPDKDDEFISFVDTMREETTLMTQVDFMRVAEIKEELESLVPNRLYKDVYRPRYDKHMENILIGIAKYNSMIESREEICIKDDDYEDMKTIMEFVLQSWKQNPTRNIEALSTEAQVAYLSPDKADLYNLVDRQNKLTRDQIESYTDDDLAIPKVNQLIEQGLLKEVNIDGSEDSYVVPQWFSYGDEV